MSEQMPSVKQPAPKKSEVKPQSQPPSEGEILITVDIINGVRSLNRTLMRYQLPGEIIRAVEKWCVEQEGRIANANVKKG